MSVFADSLGKAEDAEKYFMLSKSYMNVFDHEKNWFRPKNKDGNWLPWPEKGRLTQNYGSRESNPYQQGWFVPHDVDGLAERPNDGENLLPMLQGKMMERKSYIPFASIIQTPRAAIIQEDFKLCTNLSESGSEDALYHLHDDPAEKNNLIAAHSKLAESMKAQLREWVVSCRKSFDGEDYREPYEAQGRFLNVETERESGSQNTERDK